MRVRGLATVVVVAAASAGLSGCGKSSSASSPPPGVPALRVGPENVVLVDSATVRSGPALSGTLVAEREAILRAQLGANVVATLVEEGQPVRTGQTLVRLDDVGVRDQYLAARAAVRSADESFQLARRMEERLARLREEGAVASQDWEDAVARRVSAEGALEDARARMVNAEKTVGYTQVKAPFSGVISERTAKAGDVVQSGTSLVTVVDPGTLRLEATVPVDQLTAVRVGRRVEFTVTGMGNQRFTGTVTRVNPSVDPATRQVRVYVSLPNRHRQLVAGLFAEGRIESARATALAVPISAVDERGASPSVLRLKHGKVERVAVTLGLRDEMMETVAVTGLEAGDTLLVGTALELEPGTPVQVDTPAASIVSPGER